MTAILSDVAAAEELLRASPEHRILKMFRPRDTYGVVTDPAIGLFVDVEATGLNTDEDSIIQLGAIRFEYDRATGAVGRVLSSLAMLEDPGRPLDPVIVEVTGLTDEALRGKRIDDTQVAAMLSDVELVVAHNAEFDRHMTERRFEGFDSVPWACSQRDVPWERFGCRYVGLEFLLMKACGEFYLPHDALDDCRAALHVLATPRADERLPFSHLLEAAREPTLRVWAWGSAMWTKDRLRLRRYRWNANARCWWKDVKPADVEREREWLCLNVYDGNAEWAGEVETTTISAVDRYSRRAD